MAKKKCPRCDGDKVITCSACHGSGRHGTDPDKSCPECQGKKKKDCWQCNGSGYTD